MNRNEINATDSLPLSDFMLLSKSGSIENALVKEMLNKAKRNYVDSKHALAITQMHSKNKYKDGKWKTYIQGQSGRKEIIRDTEEAIYEELYKFYKAQEERSVTTESVFLALVEKKRDQLGRSLNTIADDKRYFSYLSNSIKNKPLADVTEEDLRRWLVKEYMPTKPKESALRKMIQLLKQIFRHGMMTKLCLSNPAEYILFDDYAKDCDLTKKTDEERAFSANDAERLEADALKHQNNPRSIMRLLAKETGMRAGELPSLLWSDVSDGFIHVHRQQIRITDNDNHYLFYDVEYTKDERKHPHNGRLVPRTAKINRALDLAKKLPGESEYVFHDKDGEPITKDSYAQHLNRACKRLRITTQNNHAFRIAVNSRMIECGLSAADRALILGHAVQTNEHHYSVSDKRRLEEISLKFQ